MVWTILLVVVCVVARVAWAVVQFVVAAIAALIGGGGGRGSGPRFDSKGGGVWDHPSGSVGDVWLDPRMYD